MVTETNETLLFAFVNEISIKEKKIKNPSSSILSRSTRAEDTLSLSLSLFLSFSVEREKAIIITSLFLRRLMIEGAQQRSMSHVSYRRDIIGDHLASHKSPTRSEFARVTSEGASGFARCPPSTISNYSFRQRAAAINCVGD